MADEPKSPKPVEFFFEEDLNYRIVASNGAWVGITPRGDMQIDFFVERQSIPQVVRHDLTEHGLGEELSREPGIRIVRQLQMGVLFSLDAADSLADLIKTKIAELKKMRETK